MADPGDDRETAQILAAYAEEVARLDRTLPRSVHRFAALIDSALRLPQRLRRSLRRRLRWPREIVPPDAPKDYRRYRGVVTRHDRLRGTTGETVLAGLTNPPLISVIGQRADAAVAARTYPHAEVTANVANARGDWVLRLAPGDTLTTDALIRIAEAAARFPTARVIYGDEDRIDAAGRHCDPWFKSAFNPELLMSENAFGRALAIRSDRARALADWTCSDHALALHAVRGCPEDTVVHVPRVILSRGDDGPRHSADRAAVEEFLCEALPGAVAMPHPCLPDRLRPCPPLPDDLPLVSILIPTRNGAEYLGRCLETLYAVTTYPRLEVIVADNGSDDPVALALLERAAAEHPGLRVLQCNYPFNFARLTNEMAGAAQGEVLVLMNNDIEVLTPDWVEAMLGWALAAGCGPVGAGLWFPNDTLQHGGIVLGLGKGGMGGHGGAADHAHMHLPEGHPGEGGRAMLIQRMTGVTAALLMIRKDLYRALGGMDEDNLAVTFNDVDLCLKAGARGHASVWTPFARFRHHEGATRGRDRTPERIARFRREAAFMDHAWGWGGIADPFYNPNLSRRAANFTLADAPRDLRPRTAAAAQPLTPGHLANRSPSAD